MDEKNLFKIALLCSLIGILIIMLISDSLEVPSLKIHEVSRNVLEKQIKVSGTIKNLKFYSGLIVFDIQDETGKIKVIAYEEEVNFKENLKIELEGIVKEYKNNLEIETKTVRLI